MSRPAFSVCANERRPAPRHRHQRADAYLTPEGIQRIESALAEGIGLELHAESDDAIRTFLQQAAVLTTPPAGNGAMQ